MSEPNPCPACETPLGADGKCPACAPVAAAASAAAPAAPEPPPVPLSALALTGALLAGAGATLLLALLVSGDSLPKYGSAFRNWFAFVGVPFAAVFALAAGGVTSVVAWVRIRSRPGSLRGQRWAAAGTFLPVAAWCLSASVPNFGPNGGGPGIEPARKEGRVYFVPESASGARIEIDPDEESRIGELWSRVRKLPGAPTLAQTEGLYSDDDFEVLKSLLPAGLAKDARSGELGLPLLPRDVLSCPDLTLYSLTRVRFGAPIASDQVPADRRAVATATDGRRVIRFVLTRDGARSEWYFAPYKVEYE